MTEPIEEFAPAQPTLLDVIGAMVRAAIYEVHVSMPAQVTAWDADRGTVDVQPLLKRTAMPDGAPAELVTIPPVLDVPYLFPSAGAWTMSAAPQIGEEVLLVFGERSLESWKAGAAGQAVDPQDTRTHALSDAVALPGLRRPTAALPGVTPALRIAHETAQVRLELSETGVTIEAPTIDLAAGGGAARPYTRGDALAAFLESLRVWLLAHTHPPIGGPPVTAAALPPVPGDLLSQTITGR